MEEQPMGAWPTGIFDNDTALDAVGRVEAILRCKVYHPGIGRAVAVRRRLNKKLRLLICSCTTPIDAIVLCGLVMRNGAQLMPELRDKAIEAMRICDEGDHFYLEAELELEAALAAYPNDGSAWCFQKTGLLQTISRHIAARKPGMVNVQRPSRKQPPGPPMPIWH